MWIGVKNPSKTSTLTVDSAVDMGTYTLTAKTLKTDHIGEATATHCIEHDNMIKLGYNSGSATVANGGTISHGLGATPTCAIVVGSVFAQFCSITAKSSTTLTIGISNANGDAGSSQTVYWLAVL